MKLLLVSGSNDLPQSVSLILRVRWPDLSLLHASETREGLELVCRERPNIVMLDLDSAPLDCFDFIVQVRSFSDVPLIVLSEKDDVMDKIRALETGADDWMSPSSIPMEFIAKVNAVVRRCLAISNNGAPSCFFNGKVTIDYASREACVLGKQAKLTPIEHKILCQLITSAGSVVTSADLRHRVWGPDYRADPEFLKKYIYRLRCKLEEDPANPKIIITERGVGYYFNTACDSAQESPVSDQQAPLSTK